MPTLLATRYLLHSLGQLGRTAVRPYPTFLYSRFTLQTVSNKLNSLTPYFLLLTPYFIPNQYF